jgi:hypothetical protein
MKRFYWSAICNDERIQSISEISEIIDKYGIILTFKKFSDFSLGITVEIEECKVNNLYDQLKRKVFIEGFNNDAIDSAIDCNVLINVTFVKGTGDLEIEVPAIIE